MCYRQVLTKRLYGLLIYYETGYLFLSILNWTRNFWRFCETQKEVVRGRIFWAMGAGIGLGWLGIFVNPPKRRAQQCTPVPKLFAAVRYIFGKKNWQIHYPYSITKTNQYFPQLKITLFLCEIISAGSKTMQILTMTAKNFRMKSLMPTYHTRSYRELTFPIDRKIALKRN